MKIKTSPPALRVTHILAEANYKIYIYIVSI